MVMLILGALLFAVGGILDSVFRFRMSRLGQKWALLHGGAFDYSRYHKVRQENGWAAYLGAQYRRLRSKLGAPKAITAMAHRLARLVYRMLKYAQQYVDKGAEYYERRNRQQQIEFLRKKAARLGLQLAPAYP
jgi:hypothetical protein